MAVVAGALEAGAVAAALDGMSGTGADTTRLAPLLVVG